MEGCVFLKTKKLLSLFLCIAVLLGVFFWETNPIIAEGATPVTYESPEPVTPPESDFSYEMFSDSEEDGVIITGYSGKETKIIIPETLDGLTVVEIASDVFAGNKKLTYIKLPAGLIYLSGDAFKECFSLKKISVDKNNPDFVSVDGVIYTKDTNKNSENYGNPLVLLNFPAGKSGSFTIPYGVKTIDTYAFAWCYNLTEIKMYNTVTAINAYAFLHCWGLESIRLSDNLITIGKEALAYCESLRYIDLPSSLISIGKDALLGGIDYENNKFYYFTDGISCVKNSYAYKYILDQWLPKKIIKAKDPSLTDIDTGITVMDPYRVLPTDGILDIKITPVAISKVESLFPTRYNKAYAFDISFTLDGEAFRPNGNIIINFDKACDASIPSATKIYRVKNGELINVGGSAHLPFVGAQIERGGRFVILANNDFSLKGDIDGDGIITIFDVKAALYASSGVLTLTPQQAVAANVNNSKDGKITTSDVRKILRSAGGMSA